MLEGCWALNWCLPAAEIPQMEPALQVWWWEVGEIVCQMFGHPVKQLKWFGVTCEAWGKPGKDACIEGETCVD